MSAVPITPVEQRLSDIMSAVSVLREYLEHPADADERRLIVNTVRKLVEKRAPSVPTAEQLRGFDKFWTSYPKRNGLRVGKAAAKVKWAALPLDDKRQAYKAMLKYASFCQRTETAARDASRFLTNGFWRDFLEDADPVAPSRPSWVPAHAVSDGMGGWQY